MQQFGLTKEQFSETFAEAMESDLIKKAAQSKTTYQLHYKKSLDAAPDFPDASLDAIFVDGLHTYEGVVDDIKAFAPKVKKGGLLMFNDYQEAALTSPPEGYYFPGVVRAIQEFAKKEGKDINVIGDKSH